MEDIKSLEKIAQNARKDILKQVYNAKSGHLGGALSIVEILTVLYFNQMKIDSCNPNMEERDRFILSKGHASAALYSILSQKGYFDKCELDSFRKIGSNLQGHPDSKKTKGVDSTSGSLGQGLSVACGMAIGNKLKKIDNMIYCLLGDGEIQEGQVWEAAMTASHYKLDNLCIIIDNNNLQIDGEIDKVMSPYPIDKKFESFGFDVYNVNGNSIDELLNVFSKIEKNNKPTAIIAKTIKGKGISFMENNVQWHGKAPSVEEYEKAIKELDI